MEPCDDKNTVDAEASVFSAMQQMKKFHGERLIVTAKETVLGVVSLSDILRFVSMRLEKAHDPPLAASAQF